MSNNIPNKSEVRRSVNNVRTLRKIIKTMEIGDKLRINLNFEIDNESLTKLVNSILKTNQKANLPLKHYKVYRHHHQGDLPVFIAHK